MRDGPAPSRSELERLLIRVSVGGASEARGGGSRSAAEDRGRGLPAPRRAGLQCPAPLSNGRQILDVWALKSYQPIEFPC